MNVGGDLVGGRFPDFVIAGFSKSGTTLICRILNDHDDVYCGSGQ